MEAHTWTTLLLFAPGPEWLPASLARALGWTVLHSLWQGAAIALALVLANRVFAVRHAQSRYLMAVGAQSLILLCALLTFSHLYEPASSLIVQSEYELPAIAQTPFLELHADISWRHQAADWIEPRLPLITLCWLTGVLLFSLRILIGSWWFTHYLRRTSQPAPRQWQEKLAVLAKNLGVQRPVRLLESPIELTPFVAGFWKPIIFFPLGLLSHVPPAYVEAVLVHELAHVVRRDYLVNIYLLILEALFFFNPAVWVISAMLRREREYCCDEIAIRHCSSVVEYAQALLALARPRSSSGSPVLGLGAWRSRPELLHRIQRLLISQPNNPNGMMEKTFAMVLVAVSVLFLSMQAGLSVGSAAARSQEDKVATAALLPTDTLPPGKISLKTQKDGRSLEARIEDRKIVELKVDGREVPAESYRQYESELVEMLRKAPPPPPAPPAPPAPKFGAPAPPPPPPPPSAGRSWFRYWPGGMETEEDIQIEIENGDTTVIRRSDRGPRIRIFGDTAFSFGFGDMPEGFRMWQGAPEDLSKRLQEMSERLREQSLRLQERMPLMNEEDMRKFQEEFQLRWRDQQGEMQDLLKGLGEFPREFRAFPGPDAERRIEIFPDRRANSQQRIERSLLQDGLIPDKGKYRFELSSKNLKINGQKQPDNLHQKYRKLYEDVSGIPMDPKSRIVIEKEVEPKPERRRTLYNG